MTLMSDVVKSLAMSYENQSWRHDRRFRLRDCMETEILDFTKSVEMAEVNRIPSSMARKPKKIFWICIRDVVRLA